MGLELRRWICGRCWGRALAPPSSAEGERCGCLGPSAVSPGAGTVGRPRRKGTPGWETRGRLWSTETEEPYSASWEKADWAVESGPCGGDGTPVYGDGETPWRDRK